MESKQTDAPAVPVPSAGGVWKTVKPFVNGGSSGMLATCIIQPIDMVKVRLQLGATGSPVSLLLHLGSKISSLLPTCAPTQGAEAPALAGMGGWGACLLGSVQA